MGCVDDIGSSLSSNWIPHLHQLVFTSPPLAIPLSSIHLSKRTRSPLYLDSSPTTPAALLILQTSPVIVQLASWSASLLKSLRSYLDAALSAVVDQLDGPSGPLAIASTRDVRPVILRAKPTPQTRLWIDDLFEQLKTV